jgi:hypothetical protein
MTRATGIPLRGALHDLGVEPPLTERTCERQSSDAATDDQDTPRFARRRHST